MDRRFHIIEIVKIGLLIVQLLICSSLASAQDIDFDRIKMQDGLPDNTVRDIFQDSRGYMWFATFNGISRYDGKNFKSYYSSPGDTTSLGNNRIEYIKEDRDGFIWGISLDGNVHRIDPANNVVTDLFSQILKREVPIKDYIITSKGDLWLWGDQGCIHLSYSANRKDLKSEHFTRSETLPDNRIHFIHEDCEGKIWIGTKKGLVRIHNSPSDMRLVSQYLDGLSVKSVLEVGDQLFFGTYSSGLRCYDRAEGGFRSFPLINEHLETHPIYCMYALDSARLLLGSSQYIFDVNPGGMQVARSFHSSIDSVREFFVDHRNNIWISQHNRGIYRYEQDLKNLVYYSLEAEKRDFLGDLDHQVFLEDSNHDLWVGVRGGGVFLYRPEYDDFRNYLYSEENANSLSSNFILDLCEDNSKNLWIGTMVGGISKIDLSTDPFFWKQPVRNPVNTYVNTIRAAVMDKNGNLWLGSKGGKIYCYDKEKVLCRTIPDDLSLSGRKLMDNINVYCLIFDDSDNLWVATKGKGLFALKDILDTPVQDMEIVHFDVHLSRMLDEVFSIIQDDHGQFWIGSHISGVGLLRDPFTNPTFESFSKEKYNLASDQIRYFFNDKSGNLWIGGADGISFLKADQLTSDKKDFKIIQSNREESSSLVYPNVACIFQSEDSSIFATTLGGGISRLSMNNIRDERWEWENFNTEDGLTSNMVYSILEDKDNNLWMCTSNGINRFNPLTGSIENFFVEKTSILNYFTESCGVSTSEGEIIFGNSKGFLYFNPMSVVKDSSRYPVVLSRFMVNGNEILPKASDLLDKSIEFEDQIELKHLQNSFQIEFSVLDYRDPDKIQFSFKLENWDKDWSTPLTMNKAIYQNMPPGRYTFLLKATNSDGVEMPEIKQFGIVISPPFAQSPLGILLIVLVSGIILFTIFFLYRRQVDAKNKVSYMDRLNEKKLQYYTNISHEFKNPLTMIINPVQDIVTDIDASEVVKKRAKQIHKNAIYLLNLVEQILDFRKIREEQMKLSLAYIDIVDYIRNLADLYVPLAEKKNIDFRFTSNRDEILGYVDCKVMNKILNNLLSNAFKFTPEGKSIEVGIDWEENSDLFELSVKDEGRGIKKEDLSRIFERFHRNENSSGLGLSFVKELVALHKGTIEVESELNRGTHFRLSIPLIGDERSVNLSITGTDKIQLSVPPILQSEQLNENSSQGISHKNSILIIEDNVDMREYLEDQFKKFYFIYKAGNGEEGLNIALQESPDFIVCDLNMPVMDGIETIRNLRENFTTSHIPVILLTADSSEEKKIHGLETGAVDYITKPFDFKLLKFKIDNYISNRKKLINKFNQEPNLPADVLTNSDQDKKFIDELTRVIDESIGNIDFNIDFLAKKTGHSRTNLYNKVKGITGVTPHQYILSIQMKKAALLLEETSYPISEVGLLVGFNDANYFSKSFKKHFGKTPKSYQVELKKS
jgi:signal transduction histidine kinase/ligand-binding sensor domain-containing protein/DNA-binding response OmpR family regulator